MLSGSNAASEEPKIRKGLIKVQECREDERGYVLGSLETRTYVSSKCTGCKGNNTGPEF